MFRIRVQCLSVATALRFACATASAAQSACGVVDARVIDARTSEPLVAAIVLVQGSAVAGVTDRDGRARLLGVASGPRTLVISFLGRRDQAVEIEVAPGATLTRSITFDCRRERVKVSRAAAPECVVAGPVLTTGRRTVQLGVADRARRGNWSMLKMKRRTRRSEPANDRFRHPSAAHRCPYD